MQIITAFTSQSSNFLKNIFLLNDFHVMSNKNFIVKVKERAKTLFALTEIAKKIQYKIEGHHVIKNARKTLSFLFDSDQ